MAMIPIFNSVGQSFYPVLVIPESNTHYCIIGNGNIETFHDYYYYVPSCYLFHSATYGIPQLLRYGQQLFGCAIDTRTIFKLPCLLYLNKLV